jgi:hypothetical protein
MAGSDDAAALRRRKGDLVTVSSDDTSIGPEHAVVRNNPSQLPGKLPVMRSDYHGHPYGELNMVVPLDKGAQLKGLQDWRGPGADRA